jgi:cysteine desulfurase
MHSSVRAAVAAALEDNFGNPSSPHWAGRAASQLVNQARAEVAMGIGCQADEVYFTSGATEADNLALLGVLRQYEPGKAHLITSAIEHHAVLHAAQQLEREGYSVTYLAVDSQGLVAPDEVARAIRPETILISIMAVNNEVGSIQPVDEIGRVARQHSILFHSDAVQGIGFLDIDVKVLNIDLLSLSAHKIYGPKGIGALYVRQGVAVSPLVYGGPQERSLRPGTENVPGIVGLGATSKLMREHKAEERIRLQVLRERLVDGLRARVEGVVVNGPASAVAPHVVSASFPGADAEAMLARLSREGIAVSMGSACTSTEIKPSHVLTALGLPLEQIEGTLRISLGLPTTPGEIDAFLEIMPDVVEGASLS